ncbi:protein phosphatase 1 regulatory subunit 3G isoform X2 [Rana temporaria]|uniref:protein phosphatase 1 regulatory subunit 3G isoform X2 n=1 Tax=Rana temporaria TaxID=8407 RepID=UPI001AAE0E52|nr:protein phosphatase 1 regulatory subunit 3G isoform X2 [Rana temporaria]
MKPLSMQDHRLHLHTDMHGNQTEQQSDLEHKASMQQQCVLSLRKDLDHHGQVEGCLQHSAPGEQPSRLQLSPGGLLQGVNQQISAEGKDLQVSSLQEDLHCSGCQDPTNLEAEDPHSGLQKVPAKGIDLHCSGCQDPTNLEAGDLHGGVQNQLNELQVSNVKKDLYFSGSRVPTSREAEGPNVGVQDQRNDLQVSSLQKDLYRFGSQGPANLEPKDPHCELQSQPTLQVNAEGKDLPLRLHEDLYCLGCQDSTNLGPGDPHGEIQSQLSRLHLEEANVHLVKRQGPQERDPYQPFHHHDVKGHFTDIGYPEPLSAEREPYQPFHHHDVKGYFTDIRYPEPLSTEESPRRRARSLPWNSIPEEDEEDSVMCCCKLKKRVKFADSLGLTLASIKHFLPSDEPLVPQAVLARLQSYPPTARGQRSDLILEDEFRRAELAPSEGTPAELLEKLNEQGVCLEQVSATRLGVLGYVLVKDPEEKAQVKIRYTFNEWLSFLDCPATPTSQSTALPSTFECRRFHFNLCYPPTTSCIRFAICFNTGNGQEMWDNNKGDNYTVYCQQAVIQEIQQSAPDLEEWGGSRLW